MSAPAAETGEVPAVASASLPMRHGLEAHATKMLPFETRRADAFLREQASRHDRFRPARLIARVFRKAGADCEVRFRTIRIVATRDRKSTRLNSSHMSISYAVFCLKKKKN